MIKPTKIELNQIQSNHIDPSTMKSVAVRFDDVFVRITDSSGRDHGMNIKDLLWAAKAIEGTNAKFRCICVDHGPFISPAGQRQPATCKKCRDAEALLIGGREDSDLEEGTP